MNPTETVNAFGHSDALGRLEDLPAEYVQAIHALSVAPLWPQLRGLLPRDLPARRTLPFAWRYRDLRAHLLRAGELHPSRGGKTARPLEDYWTRNWVWPPLPRPWEETCWQGTSVARDWRRPRFVTSSWIRTCSRRH